MGERINLFSTEEPVSTDVDNAVFDNMLSSSADPNMDNLLAEIRSDPLQGSATGVFGAGGQKDTKAIHAGLMAAGFSPGLGNIADIADATLYALEGEFGEAAWSAASAIPVIGQMVAGKRALRAAKEAGEEMVTLYRGVNKWHKGNMVRKGNFVGGSQSGELYTTTGKKFAEQYEAINPNSILLEFEVPKSYIKGHAKLGKIGQPSKEMADMMIFKDGLPKEFLKKVHK